MLSLIEVTCPHCGARGQIMLPPLGAIIVGPCPECQGMVCVFCGRVLALDKEVMVNGSLEEKRQHLMDVLDVFLNERLDRLFTADSDMDEETPDLDELNEAEDAMSEHKHNSDEKRDDERINLYGNTPSSPISKEEMDSFVNVDLKLLDNKDYFKAVFG